MKLVDIANEIFVDNGSPTSTSIPAIAFWIRGQIGRLNTLLYESFVLSEDTLEITLNDADIPYEAIAVIKQMYRIYDLECQIRANMNALAASTILSWQDQGTEVTRVNRNSVSQTIAQIRRDELQVLTDLITAYRNRSSMPSQVAGDDTIGGPLVNWPPGYYVR